jgi:hypothetical protein
MAAEQVAEANPPQMTQGEHRAAFFRQSSWLMFATIASGVFTWGVHFLSKKIPAAEYGILGTLLSLTMCIPSMPLQMVFTQQTAAALATQRERQLRGMIRLAWLGTSAICLLAGIALIFLQKDLMARWEITNPAALWVTLVAVVATFWMPIFLGLMQGQQNFFWYGWTFILHGVGRLGTAAFLVLVLGAYATGIMTGVAAGYGIAVAIGIWQTRALWRGPADSFDWRTLLRQIVPLMLGFGAYQFLFAADTMFVRTYLPGQSEYYFAAGTLSRALIWVVGPLTAVMFPKIVHSTARAEKSNLMVLTLLCTAALAGAGVFGLWLVGPWVVRLVYPPEYVAVTTSILPWYAAAMVPLSLGAVLVNNLLAKSEFRIVPALVILAVSFGITLTYIHSSLLAILQTLGAFNLLLVVVCAVYTWGPKARVARPVMP